jgi:hypothetical protein
MGFRFQRRLSLGKGTRLNVGKRGASVSRRAGRLLSTAGRWFDPDLAGIVVPVRPPALAIRLERLFGIHAMLSGWPAAWRRDEGPRSPSASALSTAAAAHPLAGTAGSSIPPVIPGVIRVCSPNGVERTTDGRVASFMPSTSRTAAADWSSGGCRAPASMPRTMVTSDREVFVVLAELGNEDAT